MVSKVCHVEPRGGFTGRSRFNAEVVSLTPNLGQPRAEEPPESAQHSFNLRTGLEPSPDFPSSLSKQATSFLYSPGLVVTVTSAAISARPSGLCKASALDHTAFGMTDLFIFLSSLFTYPNDFHTNPLSVDLTAPDKMLEMLFEYAVDYKYNDLLGGSTFNQEWLSESSRRLRIRIWDKKSQTNFYHDIHSQDTYMVSGKSKELMILGTISFIFPPTLSYPSALHLIHLHLT
ncbi:unnamed protein product [Protopolystoma xenopodis]|uniref:Uncharacterized protein n=1 Tax=Protopolystoma xenopodis TaxID=117903 RepID=A0A448XFD2_9PLAT|nr:unnamed protein product [Protopolystoma xenopodis]